MRFYSVQLCVAGLFLTLTGGCSLLVADAGKDVDKLLREESSRGQIEAMVGRPIRTKSFASAPRLTIGIADGTTAEIVSFAEYKFQGRADDYIQFQDLVIMDALTLGVGEMVAFPVSLIRSVELSGNVHDYRVWYDSADRCVAAESRHWGWGETDPTLETPTTLGGLPKELSKSAEN